MKKIIKVKKRENINNKIRTFDFNNRNKYINDYIEELHKDSFE